jgi:FdhD protein
MTDERPALKPIERVAFRGGTFSSGYRSVPTEVPVAFSYGGTTHAVMMATPQDLTDFAYGFSLTEGIIASNGEISTVEILVGEQGIDVQITLHDETAIALKDRRRQMAGPVGCGMCGIESIEQAVRKVPFVGGNTLTLAPKQIIESVAQLNGRQPLNMETRAVHGAAFYLPGKGILAVREDVGRHNALDKLAGFVLQEGLSGAEGAVVVTSRVSVEMVQKTAILGSNFIIAISAPSELAIRTASEAGMTLVALVRGEEFDIYTHADRVDQGVIANVA